MAQEKTYDFIVIGGGASGFFGAIHLAQAGFKVVILEKFQKVLSKLAISGGGRCNVTHHQFDPKHLIQNYPRGYKALLGPFHKFGPQDMMKWLETAGVELKKEQDGRVFPTSDSSQTIIDCFLKEAVKNGVDILKGIDVKNIVLNDPLSEVITNQGSFFCKNILVATGSSQSMWHILRGLGHHIVEPTPSLFALNLKDTFFKELSGTALQNATIRYKHFEFTGPVLFTHFGISGPCVLKLSSFAALDFKACDYKTELELDMLPDQDEKDLFDFFMKETKTLNQIHLGLPKRLWESLLNHLKLDRYKPLSHIPKTEKTKLVLALKKAPLNMDGKTTHKEEFVTAGGVDLNEVNFSTMQSKLHPQLYFAGEVLNIDGVTGGFNFQAAWTTSFLVAQNIKSQK